MAAPQLEPDDVIGFSMTPRDPQLLNQMEMLSLVKKYAAEISSSLMEGERHRERAVRQRDAIKLACIQDRLSNMKFMKKLSDNRLASVERPTVRADELSLRHEFRGVEMAHERVLQLQRELVECVGENLEASAGGDGTQVPASSSSSIDPGGTSIETPPPERPLPASTFQ